MDPRSEDLARIPALYVEDEPVNVLLMQALFEYRPQLSLITATCAADALALARERPLALLLLDLHLPDCHGTELLRQLRGVPGCERVPAVAVTADRDFQPAGSGFSEVWLKPFLLFHTLARMDRLLGTGSPASPHVEKTPGRLAKEALPLRRRLRTAL